MKKFLVFLCLLTYLPGYACHCHEITIEEGVQSAEIVVKGCVISAFNSNDWKAQGLQYDDSQMRKVDPEWMKWFTPLYFITIKVETVYKGDNLPDTITILSTVTGASCGFRNFFDPGESYIIYAHSKAIHYNSLARSAPDSFPLVLYTPHFYWTNHCTRTWFWSKEEEEGILSVINNG
ncbi:MAG: hypothetical protein LBV72_07510 [Tannerella sp.]|jgi:hypothetical protein|nr:hypothetical protein [Tannerella sp.]